ncbi:hypothetical protein J4Q44_G00132260 [Coregonus suidteri]|uniref:Uncharacterized protein n=1 Tax=Coregonus suidteri TaxID=861788 RepID=A0AAN8LXM0_9TELE
MTTPSLYPTHTIICKVPKSSSEFQAQIPFATHWFSYGSQRRAPIGRWCSYSFYTLDGVSIHPVTTMIQSPFLTQLPAEEGNRSGISP